MFNQVLTTKTLKLLDVSTGLIVVFRTFDTNVRFESGFWVWRCSGMQAEEKEEGSHEERFKEHFDDERPRSLMYRVKLERPRTIVCCF
jgi:hypothetical protein